MNVRPFLKIVWGGIKRNAPKILGAGAISAEVLGFYFMHREAPIVRDRLDELGKNAKWTDKVKTAAPVYLPAAGMLILSSGCIVASITMGERRAAAMATLYSASEAMVRKYERKIHEHLGKEKAAEVKENAVKEVIAEGDSSKKKSKVPELNEGNDVIYTSHGNDIFREPFTGHYFTSSKSYIENAFAKMNNIITADMWGSVKELLVLFDFPDDFIGELTGAFGWDSTDLYEKKSSVGLDYSFKGGVAPNGHSCLEIKIYDEPKLYNARML